MGKPWRCPAFSSLKSCPGVIFTDPDETMVVQPDSEPQAVASQAPQINESSGDMVKIEDLLGWSGDEKSPFSELDEESQEDDLIYSSQDTDTPIDEKGGAMVIEEVNIAGDWASSNISQEPKHALKAQGLSEPEVVSEGVPQETVSQSTEIPPLATGLPVNHSVSMPQVPELSSEQMEAIVSKISHDMIEKVVWEVVPSLAEIAIKKEIERINSEDLS